MVLRRGRSRILIYVLPALVDLVVALVLFVNPVRAAQMDWSATVVAGLMATWGLCYMAACTLVGALLRERHAARWMFAACGSIIALCGLFTLTSDLAAMYVLVGLSAGAGAAFFVPFQIFMKRVDAGTHRSLGWSVGMFTFAWSMGFAAGPFVAGFLMELGRNPVTGRAVGWKYAYAVAAGAAALTALGVWLLKHHAEDAPVPAEKGARGETLADADARGPDLHWAGWLGGAAGLMVQLMILGVFPKWAAAGLHYSESVQGTVFFCLSMGRAATALALTMSRSWMYRGGVVAGLSLFGAAGAAAFSIGDSPLTFYLAAAGFGVYAGTYRCHMAYHSLAHPTRATGYISITESLVGGANVAGPMLGGLLAQFVGFRFPYALGAFIVAAMALAQVVMHRRA